MERWSDGVMKLCSYEVMERDRECSENCVSRNQNSSFSRTLFYFENLRVQIACHSERNEESEAEGRSFFF